MISHEDITAALSVQRGLEHVTLRPLDADALRKNAPGIVSDMGTYDNDTLKPARGGLFDEESFGAGETLDFVPLANDAVVLRERARRFARIVMPCRVAHPFVGTTSELPVLPPDLRPIARRDGEILMSDVNCHYQDVLMNVQRLEQLSQLKGCPPSSSTRSALGFSWRSTGSWTTKRTPNPVAMVVAAYSLHYALC